MTTTKTNNCISIHPLESIFSWGTFGGNYSLGLYQLCTSQQCILLPFFLANTLKLSQAAWRPWANNFPVLPQILNSPTMWSLKGSHRRRVGLPHGCFSCTDTYFFRTPCSWYIYSSAIFFPFLDDCPYCTTRDIQRLGNPLVSFSWLILFNNLVPALFGMFLCLHGAVFGRKLVELRL